MLLLITKFVYNNIKNTSTKYISLEFNYKYYLYAFYKDNIHPQFKFKSVDKLAIEFENLIAIYRDNFYYI